MIELLNAIAQTIYDKKGVNVLALDIREVTSFAEYFILAEGMVERHVQAIAQGVIEKLKSHQITPLHVEGMLQGDWIVIDCGWLIIHLFTQEMREKYDLESLWREANVVDVKIVVDSKMRLEGFYE